ncbi:MAG: metallophosphoesterase [Lacunisphaera sp.]|nr:metallophosphoesterase [Lacunisphaera sp.]
MRGIEIRPGLWLDPRRAVYFAPLGLLAVADLHWGYATSHRVAGNLLPAWGDEEIARDLQGLIDDYQPAEMIWLGDSLHDLAGRTAAEEFLRQSRVPVVLVPGNHDRRWPVAREKSVRRGAFFFHHGDNAPEVPPGAIEVVGHFHPAFSWYDGAGGRLKLPALVSGPKKLILPAFSPWAAGSPWNAELAEDEQLWVIAPRRIFAVTPALLRKAGR